MFATLSNFNHAACSDIVLLWMYASPPKKVFVTTLHRPYGMHDFSSSGSKGVKTKGSLG